MTLWNREGSGSRGAAGVCLLGLALLAAPAMAAERIDRVRIDKSDRILQLLAGENVVRSYAVALGASPVGHKQRQGDERTPEGNYVLDWRNPKSAFTKSIHISYPNKADKEAARRLGVDPGGDIMIHGQPRGFGWWAWLVQRFDWTNGCVAVTDEAMADIWTLVRNGTPVEISP